MPAWVDHAPADDPENGAVEVSAAAAVRDVVAMGVGAVMVLHSADEAHATAALRRVASHFQVPVSAVARALLTLVAGTDEPVGDRAGHAAAQLLVRGLTSPT